MTKEAKQIAIIVVGILVIAGSLLVNLKKMRKRYTPVAPALTTNETEQIINRMTAKEKRAGALDMILTKEKALGAPPSEEILESQNERKKMVWKTDPFRNPAKNSRQSEEPDLQNKNFVVKGIVIKDGVGMAVINNDVVGVGETVNGCKIISIDDKGVIIEKEGKQYNIRYEQ